MSEETTKGLFIKRIKEVGYPENQNDKVDGVVWYKEDSYKDADKKLASKFEKASKALTGDTEGTPDFTIETDNGWVIVTECKEDVKYHSSSSSLSDYKGKESAPSEVQNYAIDGALHYASYVNDDRDVIAIAYSGTSENNMRVSSFILPKNGGMDDIVLLEDGEYENTIMTVEEYIKEADNKLGRNLATTKEVLDELSSYAVVTANYLRANKISAADRAGFISAVILALTNEDSTLFKNTKKAVEEKNRTKSKTMSTDLIGSSAITLLKESLQEIWEVIDKIPKIKKDTLDEFYNKLLVKSLLGSPDGLEKCKKYYKYGDNALSCCIYSVYENVIVPLKVHSDLDIMGTFYTVFLRHASGDAKDKGIVLTPKHVTELFCDIAEVFLEKKLDSSVKVIDICCGTGGFLIACLNRMYSNIESQKISRSKKEAYKRQVRESCLIGVENDPSMFALAYANMRFHKDGKSNLYACSSLLKDAEEKGVVDYIRGAKVSLSDELLRKNQGRHVDGRAFTDISVGMINPPYSTDSQTDKKKDEKQQGASELDFVYSMLSYLKPGGIGIAIVPMSCAGNKGKKMRDTIMSEHTLLACMTMPPKLFQDSKVGTCTCIMVFKAHVPHKESNKVVFLARWLDDGFVAVPHNGRFDLRNKWTEIEAEWMRQIKGTAAPNDTIYMKRELESGLAEYLPEAFVETDYTKLTDADFERELKKLALFKYMEENDLLEV